jgi:serine/threonine protein phosphatase PrpC
MLESYGISIAGGREENQDRILLDHPLGLIAVADGIGRHQSGGPAAELVIATLRHYVEISPDKFHASWPFSYSFKLSIDTNGLSTGVRLVGHQVWLQAELTPQSAGVGTP